MGKYSKVIKQLKPFVDPDPKQRERVNAVKQRILEAEQATLPQNEVNDRLAQANELMSVINAAYLSMLAGDRSPGNIAGTWVHLRRLKDAIEEWSSDTHLLLEAYQALIKANFDASGIESLRLKTGELVSIQEEPQPTVDDKLALMEWIRKEGLEGKLMLHAGTLKTIVGDALVMGTELPAGVSVSARPKFVLRGK